MNDNCERVVKQFKHVRQGVHLGTMNELGDTDSGPTSRFLSSMAATQLGLSVVQKDEDHYEDITTGVEAVGKLSKLDYFHKVCFYMNPEEERLQLWLMMSLGDKLNLLAHQPVREEAEMLALLIEFQHGSMN